MIAPRWVVAVVILFVAAAAWAVTIDGYETDWSSPDTINVDGPEADITDEYDIDENWFIWNDDGTGNLYFAMTTISVMSDPELEGTPTTADFAAILLNTDSNTSTGSDPYGIGGVGAEYYMQLTLDIAENTAVVAPLYEWNGSSWDLVGNVGYMARGDNDGHTLVEWSLDATYVGSPGSFLWGGYIDNGLADPEDHCPNNWDQEGFTPEPGSMALMLVGLPVVLVLGRRRGWS